VSETVNSTTTDDASGRSAAMMVDAFERG